MLTTAGTAELSEIRSCTTESFLPAHIKQYKTLTNLANSTEYFHALSCYGLCSN